MKRATWSVLSSTGVLLRFALISASPFFAKPTGANIISEEIPDYFAGTATIDERISDTSFLLVSSESASRDKDDFSSSMEKTHSLNHVGKDPTSVKNDFYLRSSFLSNLNFHENYNAQGNILESSSSPRLDSQLQSDVFKQSKVFSSDLVSSKPEAQRSFVNSSDILQTVSLLANYTSKNNEITSFMIESSSAKTENVSDLAGNPRQDKVLVTVTQSASNSLTREHENSSKNLHRELVPTTNKHPNNGFDHISSTFSVSLLERNEASVSVMLRSVPSSSFTPVKWSRVSSLSSRKSQSESEVTNIESGNQNSQQVTMSNVNKARQRPTFSHSEPVNSEDLLLYSTVVESFSDLKPLDEYKDHRQLRSVAEKERMDPQSEKSLIESSLATPISEISSALPTVPLNSIGISKPNESQRENKQSIDDIISEIVHLLGGNVRVGSVRAAHNETLKKRPTGTRINDRGPSNFKVVTLSPTTFSTPKIQYPWKIPSDNVSFILGLTHTFVPLRESTTTILPHSASQSESTKVWDGTAMQTTLPSTLNNDKTEIVYGKPSDKVQVPDMQTIKQAIRPTKTTPTPATNTKVLKSNKTQMNFPTGRPIVIPVEIEEVRPFVGPIPGNEIGGNNPFFPQRPPQGGFGLQPGRPPLRQPPPPSPTQRRPTNTKHRPNTPLVRIDTCIVGDESTCDGQLNERCITESGISSCQCRPGFSRNFPRGPCIPVVSLALSLKADRFGDKMLSYAATYADSQTSDYQLLEQEAKQALQTLFAYTSYSRTFMGVTVNNFYSSGGKVIINSTVYLEESTSNKQPGNRRLLQEELKDAITSRHLKIGDSQLFVNSPLLRYPIIEDYNECDADKDNDCSPHAVCQNVFGSFRCTCKPGYIDKMPDDHWKSGRTCSLCSPAFCNNHGECVIRKKQRQCDCRGKYIGSKCEIDGEVLGVALGASLAALVIIILTLSCLCVWNRRMERQQRKRCGSSDGGQCCAYDKKAAASSYRLTVEDRRRWAQIANAMGNVYVQPEHMLPPPPLPPPPPPSSGHVYSTPSRLLLQKMDTDRNRIYGHIRPKSRSSNLEDHAGAGYYDLNDFPSREEYRNPRLYSKHN